MVLEERLVLVQKLNFKRKKMKKSIYLLCAFGFTFMSCNPLEDINAEVDAKAKAISSEVSFALTDDDYEELDLKYGNFNTIDDAKTMIPDLLNDKYPVWGDGSLATVTFKFYNKINTYSEDVYELKKEEYNKITGDRYGNFSKPFHIFNYLKAKYLTPDEGDFVSLRYIFYAGGKTTLTDGFFFDGTDWNKIAGFTPDQYSAMGESYSNFSSDNEAETKIPIVLVGYFKFAPKKAQEIVSFMYNIYNRSTRTTESYTINFVFDGTLWAKYNDVAEETIKFGHNGSKWIPDNTIKYTLTDADYDLVENGKYKNFDVRAGKDEETVEARLAKINTILLKNFPNMEEGQKYIVTYNVYSGTSEVWEMKVILTGRTYVLQ